MNDTAQPPPASNGDDGSYVDQYQPPQNDAPADMSSTDPMMSTAMDPGMDPVMPPMSAAPSSDAPSSDSEVLERQNIFDLLGVKDGSDQEKEAFLDELQQVIWEDFLENDVKLLLTTDEMTELGKIMETEATNDLEKQEKIVEFLDKLIPDLEDIMLEKALELKSDLVRERIAGMKDFYATNQDALDKINQAEGLINQEKWASASQLLNGLS